MLAAMAEPIPHAGVSPAGFHDLGEDSYPDPIPQGALADDFDPDTGELRTMLGRIHVVDAAVRWQFSVELGSGGSVADQGHNFRSIRKKDERLERNLEDETGRVLRRFVQRQLVKIVEMVVDTSDGHGPDGAGELVRYRNKIIGEDATV